MWENPETFITEACEYTNSFLHFFPKIRVILNIEEDHLDFFKDLKIFVILSISLQLFLPEDGTLIINHDIQNYEEIFAGLSCTAMLLMVLLVCLIIVFRMSLITKKAVLHLTL